MPQVLKHERCAIAVSTAMFKATTTTAAKVTKCPCHMKGVVAVVALAHL